MDLALEALSAARLVVLVDRAGTGGFEFKYNGADHVFPKGVSELMVSVDVADWVLGKEKLRVWDRGNCPLTAAHEPASAGCGCDFVHRVMVKGPAKLIDALAARVGPEIAEESPVEINTGAVEGWDIRQAVDRPAGKPKKVIATPVLASEAREHLAAAAGPRR